jgi:hypothetical protein
VFRAAINLHSITCRGSRQGLFLWLRIPSQYLFRFRFGIVLPQSIDIRGLYVTGDHQTSIISRNYCVQLLCFLQVPRHDYIPIRLEAGANRGTRILGLFIARGVRDSGVRYFYWGSVL